MDFTSELLQMPFLQELRRGSCDLSDPKESGCYRDTLLHTAEIILKTVSK